MATALKSQRGGILSLSQLPAWGGDEPEELDIYINARLKVGFLPSPGLEGAVPDSAPPQAPPDVKAGTAREHMVKDLGFGGPEGGWVDRFAKATDVSLANHRRSVPSRYRAKQERHREAGVEGGKLGVANPPPSHANTIHWRCYQAGPLARFSTGQSHCSHSRAVIKQVTSG